MQRVPVISPGGHPLMPTKASRARRWLRQGKAKVYPNDLNVFAIQLIFNPSGHDTQDVAIGIDPGKLFSGVGVQSYKATLLLLHLILPFPNVTKKITARRILRRARRGRRINRKLPYKQRCHKAKRFDNRVHKKLPPSIRANRQLELRVVKKIVRLFPISNIVYEYIKARGDKGFSPVMVGQKVMLKWLEKLAPTTTQYGWQTSNLRQWLKLTKEKSDKSKAVAETHSNDGVALAASHFVKWKDWHDKNAHGGYWDGEVVATVAPFKVIARVGVYRRQLHFSNPDSHKPKADLAKLRVSKVKTLAQT
ncbi:MAG: RRXRR domain-containing protein [Coleofasciculus sp. D1-CHI-01]|uniref:RRXRR domain-containing protein n=1 Tax=Coleofasciculus sp. D1-CHI-01 TaxID=3068482 RepID=UPI0032FD42F2